MGEQLKSWLLLSLLQQFYSYFRFHLPAIQFFILTWEKNSENTYHSPPHVSSIARNIPITIIRFARYHLLLAYNSTFMTDSQYLDEIQIW